MKTYIINLERSPVRRAHIKNEVERCRLDYEFIKAVDGATLSDEEVDQLMDHEAQEREPLKLTRGSLGCLLSHLEVYRRMIEEDLEMALVLEDDAVLPENIVNILTDVARNIASSEVILLYYTSFTPCELSERGAANIVGGYKLMYPVRVEQPFCATAYVITREAARGLLEIELPMKMQCDEWGYLYDQRAIESFRCVYPLPVSVSGAKSTIGRFDYSAFRVRLTEFLDRHEIPVFSKLLRDTRLSKVKKTAIVKIVDEPSPISMKNKDNLSVAANVEDKAFSAKNVD